MEPLESSNAPYHTKFFDVITIPPPPPSDDAQGFLTQADKNLYSYLNSFNSIMCYEDAILDAIHDLRDGHHGSNVHAIQKHIQANFFHDNIPHLNEKDAELLSYDVPQTQWKEHLFVQALKSLVDKNCIEYSPCVKNGSTLYKLSHNYKKHRAEELTQRMERLKQYKLHLQEKKRQIVMNSTISATTGKKSSNHSPVAKQPILKKGHLVESQTVAIVGTGRADGIRRKKSMDLDREKQIEKRLALPHHLGVLHADDEEKSKGLRDQCKIPHGKIYVKEIIDSPKHD
mmetsp:Transcript_6918/g.13047  ORF Transcript_6918/g.13047 Transcript_6918/m.13047 type:complete len:286 (-) Transcript_6918:959-1816(-)